MKCQSWLVIDGETVECQHTWGWHSGECHGATTGGMPVSWTATAGSAHYDRVCVRCGHTLGEHRAMRPVCPGVQRTAAMSSWEDVCFTTDMERARAEKRLYGLAVPVEAP